MPENTLSSFLNRTFPLKYNLFANFFGTTFVSIVSIILTPFYIGYLGVEAYGLVGFFITFQSILSILDLGLSVTINRELAVNQSDLSKSNKSKNLFRTLEIAYWAIAVLIGILALLVSPFLVNWVNPEKLSTQTLTESFMIMSIGIAIQFPISLYSGGLFGLQKHVHLSVCNLVFGILRTIGALGILHFVSSTPQAFFIWQAIVAGFQVLAMAMILWMSMPKTETRAKFEKEQFGHIWKFAGGVSGISVLGILLTQADKVVLSKILSLEDFGYYSLASLVANGLGRITVPVFQAYFPKLSQLVGINDEISLTQVYHQGCQLMAVLILPFAGMFIFFSREILLLWQRNIDTMENTYLPLSILMMGSALNTFLTIPYALQLAHAWTKLHFYLLILAFIFLIPLTIICAINFGMVGAAAVWVLLNILFILIEIPLLHKKLLPSQKWKWYLEDFVLPIGATLIIIWIGRVLFFEKASDAILILQLGLISILALGAAFMSSSFLRNWILEKIFTKQAPSNL